MGVWALLTSRFNEPKKTTPSFAGRNVIVTGANTGVGFEAARKFVELGANKVILAVRTLSKGEAAQQNIEASTGKKNVVEVWQLDMMSYDSIREFANRATTELDHLDIAVLNAGVTKLAYQKSAYGWEECLQVNVISTALLGTLLLPKLKASKTPTFTPVLEIVASGNAHMVRSIPTSTTPLAAYNSPDAFVGAFKQYNVSKLFVLCVQAALVELTKAQGGSNTQPVNIVAICPGPTRSELSRDLQESWLLSAMIWVFTNVIMYPAEVGARIYISGAALGDKGHGKFWRRDRIDEVPVLLQGEQGKQLQQKVWAEIVETLERDVPDIKQMLPRL